jgi:hypothetical protein
MRRNLNVTLRRTTLLLFGLLIVSAALPVAAQELASPIFSYDPDVCAEDNAGEDLSPRCRMMIEAYPDPPQVEQIPLDTGSLSYYSFWRVGPEATPLYGAPGGGIVGDIPAGYNFVTATDLTNNEFIQIQGGQWVRRSDAEYTVPSNFTGVEIKDGLEHEFAFVLDLSRIAISRYPGGPRDNDSGRFLERYEVVNIYATAYDDEGWRWYMIGHNEWVRQTFVSKVSKTERPEGVSGRWVAVDLYEQTMVAYEDDTPVFATLVASGLPPYNTNEGLFEVWARLPVDPMSGATGAPEAYALQSVPYVMYFDGGISLHGSYWHDYFGYRQSHGCVNLTVSDASWVYDWFTEGVEDRDINIINHVFVHSSGEYGEPPGINS